jgi:hypothetical protein
VADAAVPQRTNLGETIIPRPVDPFLRACEASYVARESEALAQPEHCVLLHIQDLKRAKDDQIRGAVIGVLDRQRKIRAKRLCGVFDHIHRAARADKPRLFREESRVNPRIVNVVSHSANQIDQAFDACSRDYCHGFRPF